VGWVRFLTFGWVLVACSCGARTELGGVIAGSDGGQPCNAVPWVVFDYEGEQSSGIAAMRADGSSFHMLDLGGMRGWNPSVSPDGTLLFYVVAPSDGSNALMVRNLVTSQTRTFLQITVQPPSNGLEKASVSPDGKLVAYELSPDIHLASIDGSNDRVLVSGPYDPNGLPYGYGHPAFSPDSQTVYFSTIGLLESIRIDGSARQTLEQDQFFTNPSIPDFSFPNASLSPDGTELVAQIACDVAELRVFPIGSLPGDPCTVGTKLVEVGTSQAFDEASNPSWGPTQIVYDDDKDLFLIDPIGGAPTNLTQSVTTADSSFAADPVWAPACTELP
jgi:Tol biopolymer transport system component